MALSECSSNFCLSQQFPMLCKVRKTKTTQTQKAKYIQLVKLGQSKWIIKFTFSAGSKSKFSLNSPKTKSANSSSKSATYKERL